MDWLYEHAGEIGLLFFFVVFVGVAIWTYRPVAKDTYDAYGKIPLKEEDNV